MSRARAASLRAAQRRRLMLRSARNSTAAPHTTLFTCTAGLSDHAGHMQTYHVLSAMCITQSNRGEQHL